MKPTLYIIRGLPGSGKSTLAAHIVSGYAERDLNAITVEAEQFFVSSNGHKETYSFDRRFLGAAHDECYGRTMRYLRGGYSVVVANTFSTQREVDRYLTGLERTGMIKTVDVKIIKCVGKFRSPHRVPSRAIEKMKDRWQDVPNEVIFNGDFE